MDLNTKPAHPEISQQTIKLFIGLIALTLALLTGIYSGGAIDSISASYHYGGTARDIFVGFLLIIFGFLFAYNGKSLLELGLSKAAAIAALGVAFFPCQCEKYLAKLSNKGCISADDLSNAHGISALIMFAILATFCIIFYNRAKKKIGKHPKAKIRKNVYATCFVIIVASILTLLLDGLFGGFISKTIVNLTYIGEAASLVAFGVAWLTASRMLLWITDEDERFSLYPF